MATGKMLPNSGDRADDGFYFEPLNMGEILDRTIALFRKDYGSYIIIGVILLSPALVLNVLQMIGLLVQSSGGQGYESIVSCVNLILLPLVMFGQFAIIPVVSIFASTRYRGGMITWKEAFKEAFGIFGGYILTMIIITIVLIALIFGLIFGTGLLIAMTGRDLTLMIFLAVLPGLPLLLGLLYIYYATSILTPVIIPIEEIWGMDAVKRSVYLFKTSWESSIKVATIPFLVPFMLAAVIFIPVVGTFFQFVMSPISIIALVVTYYDIRIRHEAFDLEFAAENKMMQAALNVSSPGFVEPEYDEELAKRVHILGDNRYGPTETNSTYIDKSRQDMDRIAGRVQLIDEENSTD